MRVVKSGVFHRSGCEYIQERMRMVSEYTEVVANSFCEGAKSAARARRGATKDLAGQMLDLSGRDAESGPDGPASRGSRVPVKQVYVYPLYRDARRRITQASAPAWMPWMES
jgi:hypothetical protein